MKRTAMVLLLLVLSTPAYAVKSDSTHVVIPIAGRIPGALQTQWRTDVFIRSISSNDTQTGTLTFYPAGQAAIQRSFTLQPGQSATYRDIVKNTFGLDQASGQLHVVSLVGIPLEARARIFNSGNPVGEFGQGIEGIGLEWLQTQAVLFGLDGTQAGRVNVGVANPNDTPVSARMQIYDKNHTELHPYEYFTVAPHETRQFNDIFALYGIPPQDTVTVTIFSTGVGAPPIYGYSSEVRNDTGDAVFVCGTGPNAAY
ncbi:MAG: hypothetical protein ACYC7A_22535 [Thermoanaerobaculia bacterium]